MNELWWREGFNVSMSLMSITRQVKDGEDLLPEDNHLWDVDGFNFKLTWKDVKGNGDCLEEQLWAIRQGLA